MLLPKAPGRGAQGSQKLGDYYRENIGEGSRSPGHGKKPTPGVFST